MDKWEGNTILGLEFQEKNFSVTMFTRYVAYHRLYNDKNVAIWSKITAPISNCISETGAT